MEKEDKIISWLLEADPSIRWQVMKDLIHCSVSEIRAERKRISIEGWGARLLSYQQTSGMWGGGLYTPKWISTTYTMLLLKNMGLMPVCRQAAKGCRLLIENGFYKDGGINFFFTFNHSETCVTGIVLSLLSYFKFDDRRVELLAEFLAEQQMADGGWNCRSFKGDVHSSFHTTINVLEGLREFQKNNPGSRDEIERMQMKGREFLLNHKLYRSHRTGKIVDSKMTRFSFPANWRYDVMRALDYFRDCNAVRDVRLEDSIELLMKKRTVEGKWLLQNRHPGKSYFEMENVGRPSKWNTLRGMRILKWWEDES